VLEIFPANLDEVCRRGSAALSTETKVCVLKKTGALVQRPSVLSALDRVPANNDKWTLIDCLKLFRSIQIRAGH
jgi:hypothetical protein